VGRWAVLVNALEGFGKGWRGVLEGMRRDATYLCSFGDAFTEYLDFEVSVGGV
jgi:hypothetical protein